MKCGAPTRLLTAMLLPLALVGLPPTSGKAQSQTVAARADTFGRHERSIRDDMVGALDAQIGSTEAAAERLRAMGWRNDDPIDGHAFWWSTMWTTGIGLGIATGTAAVQEAPRSYFLRHAGALRRLGELTLRDAAAGNAAADAVDAGMPALERSFGTVRDGLLRCFGGRLRSILYRIRLQKHLLAAYRSLPVSTDEEAALRRETLQRYRAAQDDLADYRRSSLESCLGPIGAALQAPAFPLSPPAAASDIGDEKSERCEQLLLRLERLKSDLARTRQAIERRIPDAIANSRRQIAQAEGQLKTLQGRIDAAKAELGRPQAALATLRRGIAQLDSQRDAARQLERETLAALPEGARLFAALELLKEDGGFDAAGDRAKLDFYNRATGKNESRLPPEASETYRLTLTRASNRVAWAAANLTDLALKIPTKSADILGTALSDLLKELVDDGDADKPGFLGSDPGLRNRIAATPGRVRGLGAKVGGLIDQLDAGQARIDVLRDEGASSADLNAEAGRLTPIAAQLAVELARLDRELASRRADLAAAEEALAEEVAAGEQQLAELEQEKSMLQEAIDYESKELIPDLMRELEIEKARLPDLEEQLADVQAEYDRECAK